MSHNSAEIYPASDEESARIWSKSKQSWLPRKNNRDRGDVEKVAAITQHVSLTH